MAHVKGSGSVSQHSQGSRHGKRLGLKKTGGQTVKVGQIIIKQRGAKYKAGKKVGMGRDHTIFAMADGIVSFAQKFGKTVVSVVTKN
ncbi:MAG: 50S ribosomal protein L27 [Candidatus Pacebacteria bacterium RIFOXYB1_FULL_39_46]|nr:MAG: 50S ribosomal protein L27 [Candidatus Pacebacteria bacterium RIFOXYB1_FULL_39_46]OGJ38825.1 MAG: 50S ribosomal protein L27 [Candidatus Pacebacteria bacterium RIFOXYA1_FULL_38_18]OGJ40648.1 MAG: 50S ribosomal protein L27 [Candidatus Pacebacteria bacterium RIFOXYD1_FULL_39_27]OGJ40818.1 MAG: 50S ribosomal protein L27 [Candidatus Pacebacteria bacterium RIFOXYC1_FULL_39_21]